MTMGERWGSLLAIPGIVLACSSGARAQSCEPAAASVISVQGNVDVSDSDRAHWRDVQLNQVLCAGQQVRLMPKSRAVLLLPNETLIHLDEGSVFTLRAIEPEKPAWLDLLRGALHIISRVPRALNIRTPLVNAGTEGTEFALRVDLAQAELWVYEGRVFFENAKGHLRVVGGEAALARAGEAPERRIVIKPRRAVEWALYYPPLLDSRPQSYPEALRPAVLAYRRNDFTAAFAALDGVPEGARDARYHTLRAGLLLSVGRVPEAEGDLTSAQRLDPKNGTAYALRSVIAVVRNEQEEALKLAAEAVRLAPGSATPYVARSYVEQSAFEIEKAHESLEKAAELAPEDALVWARLAEIELSLGDLDAALESARKAEQLDPGLSRTQSVLGFAYLTRIEVDKAKSAFERAIQGDPADPLPRLGMGLAKIRDGDLDEGTREIETAASLDPNNSLVRSYLGKAYYEQKRGGLTETEFEQAKLLDPKDPTPWFYDAIHKQTTNRPVEALHDLQKAIDLNDNRAVYRSRLLLDQDLAARSASLGRIYNDLGFQQLGLVEGWKSVNTDPSNYSAHRLLADNYAALPRHEIARVSELLQSQLLQPINITPVQTNLAESNLLIVEGGGPSAPSFNEFNPLFTRNRLALQASGVFGSNNTLGDEVTQSGVWNKFSYSLGQFHFESDGFRENNDLTQDIYNVFTQVSLSPRFGAQAEFRHRETEHGDLESNFELDNFIPTFRRDLRTDTVRIGTRYTPAIHSNVITSVIYQDEKEQLEFAPGVGVSANLEGYTAEAQYLLQLRDFDLIAGGGYLNTDNSVGSDFNFNVQHWNSYIYSYIRYPANAIWTFGASIDSLNDDDRLGNFDQLNWKVGITWNFMPNTTLRLATFRTFKRPLLTDQTIEPTQVAGFNQFFDDLGGTDSRRYGIAIDHEFASNLHSGIEVSKRELKIPVVSDENVIEEDWDEQLYRVYLNWTPHPRFAVSAGYQFDRFDNEDEIEPIPDTRTHLAPVSLRYFHPIGLFSRLGATYVNQTADLVKAEERDGEFVVTEDSRDDQFVLVGASIGYRLPKRYGTIEIGVENIFNEDFDFQGLGARTTETDILPFIPERVVTAKIILVF